MADLYRTSLDTVLLTDDAWREHQYIKQLAAPNEAQSLRLRELEVLRQHARPWNAKVLRQWLMA